MSDLECGHCGGIAFTSRDIRDGVSWFTDGEGEACATCGMPGSVYVDDYYDADVVWHDVQEAGVYCTQSDCETCHESRKGGTK